MALAQLMARQSKITTMADTAADTAALKTAMRTQLRQRRRQLREATSDEDWTARGHRIATTVLAMPVVRAALDSSAARTAIAIYESNATEPPTTQLIHALVGIGIDVLVPALAPSGSLTWTTPERDRFNADPASVRSAGPARKSGMDAASTELVALGCNLVIAPALAIGRDYSRLGQGGGHFDRTIAAARSTGGIGHAAARGLQQISFVALVGPGELFDTVPHDGLDQPVDAWCVG